MIKVLVVDDQVLLQDSLKILIEREADFEVVGCASNGREAFELCERLAPDIVLMDIMMPECDGVEGTRLIKTKDDSIKVIILTTFNDQQFLAAALANGADGYVLKEVSSADLILAIRSVAKGFEVIHKKTYHPNVEQYHSQSVTCPDNHKINLTERELEIIGYIVNGKDNKVIGRILCLSPGRVKNIITAILKKLEIKDRAQLAIYAIKNNLV